LKKRKPFTGTGDEGFTSTAGGRIRKDSDLMEAIGSVDELVAQLGVARSLATAHEDIERTLKAVQTTLFRYNAALLSIKGYEITEDDVMWLEKETLTYDSKLPALSRFIIPGGTQLGATLHVSRTVCRRAERAVVRLEYQRKADTTKIAFLNRLSSLLFVLARYVNSLNGAHEELA
jgi:cob(I)alamin adenosyltransferase